MGSSSASLFLASQLPNCSTGLQAVEPETVHGFLQFHFHFHFHLHEPSYTATNTRQERWSLTELVSN